jgi:hypothetical protein
VLIAEARDRTGTRMYWMQPYHPAGTRVDWDEPLAGGWMDPGEAEMILDAAFPRREAGERQELREGRAEAAAAEGRRLRDPRRQPQQDDREVPLAGTGMGRVD